MNIGYTLLPLIHWFINVLTSHPSWVLISQVRCVIKPQTHLGGEKYSSYSFSTSALDGGELSVSRLGCALAPGKGPTVQEAGWAPEPSWTQRLDEKSFHLCRGSNLDCPVIQLVDRHYTDWATRWVRGCLNSGYRWEVLWIHLAAGRIYTDGSTRGLDYDAYMIWWNRRMQNNATLEWTPQVSTLQFQHLPSADSVWNINLGTF
jgi:hypothetical protein